MELSTTSLGKELNKTVHELRQQLLEEGLLAKKGRDWELTPNGSGDKITLSGFRTVFKTK